jgi:hypothetical protein
MQGILIEMATAWDANRTIRGVERSLNPAVLSSRSHANTRGGSHGIAHLGWPDALDHPTRSEVDF